MTRADGEATAALAPRGDAMSEATLALTANRGLLPSDGLAVAKGFLAAVLGGPALAAASPLAAACRLFFGPAPKGVLLNGVSFG